MQKRRTLAIAAVALVAVIASACSASTANTTAPTPLLPLANAATQTNEGGQVSVAVTWQGATRTPTFRVALDTHSVDLDAVDLAQQAVLRTDQGLEVQPSGWGAPKGGHHRGGTLTFPATTPAGTPVVSDNTRSIELVVRGVAGVAERRFEWSL
jgi:hypothetical protein